MRNFDATQLLFKAVLENDLSLLKKALKNGADVDILDEYVVRFSYKDGRLEVLNKMNDHPVDKLFEAIRLNNPSSLKQEIIKGVNIHAFSNLAFKSAVDKGHLDCLKLLVERGVDINECNNYALRCACKKGNLPLLQFLVNNGLDIHLDDDLALKLADEAGHSHIVSYVNPEK